MPGDVVCLFVKRTIQYNPPDGTVTDRELVWLFFWTILPTFSFEGIWKQYPLLKHVVGNNIKGRLVILGLRVGMVYYEPCSRRLLLALSAISLACIKHAHRTLAV